ncbi:benzoate/H(+) symporter BenE family transporter [Dechloromonas sp. ZS-1]|uniref:benzoate/H(+) symporter BenE family transporter n=1 Tax=Dechloromonas sp. ZS-1 TaxID=3138067 RepID=UPI0031FC9B57
MRRYFSLSHMAAGFIAVLVGFTSSAAIIFSAVSALGATQAETTSWFWALGLGMFATSVGLSLRFKAPILTAWSTPGAALLVTALAGVPMAEAIGAFLFSSLLIVLCGVFGLFDALMKQVPKSLAAALLAGVLARFGLELFVSLRAELALVGLMLGVYLAARRWLPRYAVPLAFLAGLAWAAGGGMIRVAAIDLALAVPVWTTPQFSLSTLIGVGLPLFVVTMASQNVPGLAVLRANGYTTPASPLITWTGVAGLVLAPFGGYALNLAAITAAICMSPAADPRPEERYRAAIWAGLFYLGTGIFAATVTSLFSALPHALIAAIAGLALLGTIGNGLAGALADEVEREAALVTFLCTLSGISLFGIGSAFWGLLLGMAVRRMLRPR